VQYCSRSKTLSNVLKVSHFVDVLCLVVPSRLWCLYRLYSVLPHCQLTRLADDGLRDTFCSQWRSCIAEDMAVTAVVKWSRQHGMHFVICRGELGAKENVTTVSGADVHANSSCHVLHSDSVSRSCASADTSPMFHSNQSQNFEEHLQKD